ncbi:hypothetical protein [Nocardioides stalactiti]|uniref:hypothetical protein n=1 Tax=Nocardioides stalactiti TaxID=2755356 RepID=UPI0016016749|nr:hypothetical protein [Nocardioides stalactiti]
MSDETNDDLTEPVPETGLEPGRPLWRREDLLGWAVVAVLLVAVGVLGYLTWDRARTEDAPTVADAPTEVAVTTARDFFTLDHRTIEEDMERVLASATGEFEQQYEKQSADLRKAVESKKLVLTAGVTDNGTAVEYLGEDEAWVLVSVDVRTEADGTAGEDTRYRTRLVLTRSDDDTWRVSRFEQVG